jgi:hypothetical protein
MKVQELQQELNAVDPAADVVLAANGALVPVTGITFVPGKTMAVIRGRSKNKYQERFTTEEDGVIGHLRMLGLSDEMIGEVLGRESDSVKGRRKRLKLP